MYKVLKSSKAAVRFSLKHSKKYLLENRCQESLILLWFSFGGANRRVSYSKGYTVSYADWDYQKQRVKTNKSRIINSHTVNNYLNKLETELMNTCSRYVDEEKFTKRSMETPNQFRSNQSLKYYNYKKKSSKLLDFFCLFLY